MISSLLDAIESSLNLIALCGLFLDAAGAMLVLGPEVPTISKVATFFERRRMNYLFEKLKREGNLTEGVEPFDRLFQEMWSANTIPFEVEELKLEGDKVILGAEGFDRGERTSRYVDDFQEWIDDYRGIDREYYLSGGGLLLMGFLLQIVARSESINIWFSVATLIVTFLVGAYLLYRARDYVWWVPS